MILAAITTHKREPQMVERAIKSVVNQTYQDWHLVIVDDSPADYELRDEVKRMAEEWCLRDKRITYIQHDKNYGSQRARNNALKYAVENNYEFIAYLDDDDEWLPEKLEKQLAKFNECDESVALVYCNAYYIDSTNERVKEWDFTAGEGNVHMKLLTTGVNSIGSTSFPLIRTKNLEKIGGFDEEMLRLQDYEMYIRLTEFYNVAYINEYLINYYAGQWERINDDSYALLRSMERILHKNIDYMRNDTLAYYTFLKKLIYLCEDLGENKKALFLIFKAILLKPLNIRSNIKMFLRIVYIAIKKHKDSD